jgi:hypothetical protein
VGSVRSALHPKGSPNQPTGKHLLPQSAPAERGRGRRKTPLLPATVKRAYGDWTTPNLGGWKEHQHRHAIQPIQQFAYTRGKNATDSALIIDCMDLLYSGSIDGFCLVSSDPDFTWLATLLREAGKKVYGLGERKTPEPSIAACEKVVFFEVLRPQRRTQEPPVVGLPDLRALLTAAVQVRRGTARWAALSGVGSSIARNRFLHTEAANSLNGGIPHGRRRTERRRNAAP